MANRIDAILNADLSELQAMTRQDLARNVSKLASAANKRIKRLQESGVESPALNYLEEHGGKFSVSGKNKTALLIEFRRVSDFLGSKTSTVKGAKAYKKNVFRGIAKNITEQGSEKDVKEVVKELEKHFENNPGLESNMWRAIDRVRKSYDRSYKYREIIQTAASVAWENPQAETDDIYAAIQGMIDAAYIAEQAVAKDLAQAELYL